ncbi:hypothetical protein [Sinomicrobium sp. M5D2P17]
MSLKIRLTIKQSFWLYFTLLIVLYHHEIKDYYYWKGVADIIGGKFDFSIPRLILSVLFFSINLRTLMGLNKQKLSFIVISLFFLLLTVPSLVANTSGEIYPFKLLVYHQLFFFSLWTFFKIKINLKKLPRLNKTQSLYLLIVIVTIGIIPYLWVYGPYINLKNLFLVEVYQTRTKMATVSNPYIAYTYSLYSKIIIPLIIVFSLELKNKLTFIYGVVLLILFYLFGAHKTVYVGLLIILVFYKLSYYYAIKKMVCLLNILLIVCFLLVLFFEYDYLWILTIRRVQFLPTLLDICYIDFFNKKPLLWSESVFKSFVEYPYDLNHGQLIGKHYFDRSDMRANNGLISDGYMNFGSPGILINILFASIYFFIINNLNIPSKYFGLFFLVIFSFVSSSLFTVLLTHGGIALLIVSMFILNKKSEF